MSKGFTGVVKGGLSSEGGDAWGGAVVSSRGFSAVLEGRLSAVKGSPVVICCCGTIVGGAFLVSGFCGREGGLAACVELLGL